MSFVSLHRARLRDVLWLAAFAACNFIAAHAHGASALAAQARELSDPGRALHAPAATSGHSRPRAHRG